MHIYILWNHCHTLHEFFVKSSQDKASQRAARLVGVSKSSWSRLESISDSLVDMMDRTGQVQVLVTNFQNLKKGSNCFSKCWKRHCSEFKHFALLLFCISTISSETKTGRKTNRPATQAHCLGAEASCASRMLFVAILRISSCQTWKVWQLRFCDAWYLQVAPVQVAFPIGEANSKSSKKHATFGTSTSQMEGFFKGENLLIVLIEETLHHQH